MLCVRRTWAEEGEVEVHVAAGGGGRRATPTAGALGEARAVAVAMAVPRVLGIVGGVEEIVEEPAGHDLCAGTGAHGCVREPVGGKGAAPGQRRQAVWHGRVTVAPQHRVLVVCQHPADWNVELKRLVNESATTLSCAPSLRKPFIS